MLLNIKNLLFIILSITINQILPYILNCFISFGYKLSIKTHQSIYVFLLSEAGLSPTNIFLNSTTNMFFVSWSNPTSDYELFSGYEVTWRFLGSSFNSSGPLVKNVNQYNVSSGLISGQLYTVTVMSKVTLTNPAGSFVQPSPDTPVRLGIKHDIKYFLR